MSIHLAKLGITIAIVSLSLFSTVNAKALSTLSLSLSEHQSVTKSIATARAVRT